ncbi:MAG: SUMF1/EgtB/PvdO family nonheme iron enzyme [Planctomycetia bacterium]|nr:SUMF1/EgtB/PvdO family nonheme iron enzyme [Planctomycetia bacterium]
MRVVLYTNANHCPLCDDARAALERLRPRLAFELVEVPVDRDPRLTFRYALRVPVIEVDGEEAMFGKIDPAALEAALRARRQGPAPSVHSVAEARLTAPGTEPSPAPATPGKSPTSGGGNKLSEALGFGTAAPDAPSIAMPGAAAREPRRAFAGPLPGSGDAPAEAPALPPEPTPTLGGDLSAFGRPTPPPDAMVAVRGGAFVFGEDKRRVSVPEFEIDRDPVTNGDYERFVLATGHRPPLYWRAGRCPEDLRDHPVVGVDLFDAIAYARWAGKDLPYEDEWERAARGTDGRTYPWGDEPDLAANTARTGLKMTLPVGFYGKNVSPEGCRDMVGNAWELTLSPAPGGGVVVRGGSWFDFALYAKTYFRSSARADARNGTIGFRCVRRPSVRTDAPRAVVEGEVEAAIAARKHKGELPDPAAWNPDRRDLVPDVRRLRAVVASNDEEAGLEPRPAAGPSPARPAVRKAFVAPAAPPARPAPPPAAAAAAAPPPPPSAPVPPAPSVVPPRLAFPAPSPAAAAAPPSTPATATPAATSPAAGSVAKPPIAASGPATNVAPPAPVPASVSASGPSPTAPPKPATVPPPPPSIVPPPTVSSPTVSSPTVVAAAAATVVPPAPKPPTPVPAPAPAPAPLPTDVMKRVPPAVAAPPAGTPAAGMPAAPPAAPPGAIPAAKPAATPVVPIPSSPAAKLPVAPLNPLATPGSAAPAAPKPEAPKPATATPLGAPPAAATASPAATVSGSIGSGSVGSGNVGPANVGPAAPPRPTMPVAPAKPPTGAVAPLNPLAMPAPASGPTPAPAASAAAAAPKVGPAPTAAVPPDGPASAPTTPAAPKPAAAPTPPAPVAARPATPASPVAGPPTVSSPMGGAPKPGTPTAPSATGSSSTAGTTPARPASPTTSATPPAADRAAAFRQAADEATRAVAAPTTTSSTSAEETTSPLRFALLVMGFLAAAVFAVTLVLNSGRGNADVVEDDPVRLGLPRLETADGDESFPVVLSGGSTTPDTTLLESGTVLLVFADAARDAGRETAELAVEMHRRLRPYDVRTVLVVPREVVTSDRQADESVLKEKLAALGVKGDVAVLLDASDERGGSHLKRARWQVTEPNAAVVVRGGLEVMRVTPPSASTALVRAHLTPLVKTAANLGGLRPVSEGDAGEDDDGTTALDRPPRSPVEPSMR